MMQVELTFYDPAGEIMCVYSGQNPEGQTEALSEYAWVEGHYECGTHYILAGEPVERPTQPTALDKTDLVADGVDVVVIAHAPSNAAFTAQNLETGERIGGLISGTDTFSTVVPGMWLLRVEKFPYLPWEETINAV
jgi:hypothetical protein